jgi:hypothetical protein
MTKNTMFHENKIVIEFYGFSIEDDQKFGGMIVLMFFVKLPEKDLEGSYWLNLG